MSSRNSKYIKTNISLGFLFRTFRNSLIVIFLKYGLLLRLIANFVHSISHCQWRNRRPHRHCLIAIFIGSISSWTWNWDSLEFIIHWESAFVISDYPSTDNPSYEWSTILSNVTWFKLHRESGKYSKLWWQSKQTSSLASQIAEPRLLNYGYYVYENLYKFT